MDIDVKLLRCFEAGLNPRHVEQSAIPATVVGYGEISAIFQIDSDTETVFKRMPLFDDMAQAQEYERMYHDYCRHLARAGLTLPPSQTAIVSVPGHPVVLYIAQKRLPGQRFCHRLIHHLDQEACLSLLEQVVQAAAKVWHFNAETAPDIELAIDGQLSNWVSLPANGKNRLHYIDTSTPLYRINGVEQQDPDLILQSAPGFLRWIIRRFFLDDVMTRYYDPRLVYTDLVANLFKEQKPDLVPAAIAVVNRHLPPDAAPLNVNEVKKYYREDKMIWRLFLAFRRIDRWLKTGLLRRRYEFILPGKIER
ncbi:MAG TPA: hypothetical protein ENF48_04725 [Desulfobacteraceae bacterium]|nr:hypothetical protein [Deltaproteobacteria bacterium]HDI59652.1 hypothetical protein [Desulfobacteraceae bacterium]